MKNSILFKFIAIFLCALSLVGVIGSTAGALVLAEGNLYHRTVDQMIQDNLQTSALHFAEETALAYASRELGSCPEDMIRQHYGMVSDLNYGYAIMDPEGNVLASLKPELKDTAASHSIPVSGQYMHLVSMETEAEIQAKEAQKRMELLGEGLEAADGTVIPPEGISIQQVYFTDAQGNTVYEAFGFDGQTSSYYYDPGNQTVLCSYDHPPQGRIGFLFPGADGQILYRSFLEEHGPAFPDTEIYGMMFVSHDLDSSYATENPEGLGLLMVENGNLRFAGYPAEGALPEETIPETVPEETAPAETVPETIPEETAEEASGDSESEEDPEDHQEREDAEDSEHHEEEEDPEDREDSEDAEEASEGEDEASSASAVPEEEPPEEAAAETTPPETAPPETLPPETVGAETVPAETVPAVTEPLLINGKPLEFYQVNRTNFRDSTTGQETTAKYVYLPLPEMTVEVYLDQSVLGNEAVYDVLRLVRQYRSYLLPAMGVCLLIFAVCIVYLCTAAGRKPKSEEVRAGGLNRMPLDLYLGLGIFLGTGLVALAGFSTPVLLERDFLLGCTMAAGAAFAVCLLFVGFCFAFAAQVKTAGGFWWRNTLCGHCIRILGKLAGWLNSYMQQKGLPGLGHLLKKLWQQCMKFMIWLYRITEKALFWTGNKIKQMFLWIGTKLNRFFSLMPLTWQWVLSGIFLVFLLFLGLITNSLFLLWFGIISAFALILYGSHCFGNLFKSTKIMSQGDLKTKVNSKLMLGCFREFATDLNNLADVADMAAQKQMKSERMKTELITNVSHDIKTPLTSIINYVDLLQKPHTEEEGEQYLEVLDRQSQRLKKLVDDLMEMSKATTGNMAVEITRLDAVESVNQALGEFSDKLEQAQLQPIFHHNVDSVPIMADGKLVWRILSNLLSNVVKYAMPGTRIYLDLIHVNGKVIISLKNISREELNVNAEELMERFVRGDISRHTEGSGLGLNIAKSLMELQNGHLQLLVDGDLFKVTLIFPEAPQ